MKSKRTARSASKYVMLSVLILAITAMGVGLAHQYKQKPIPVTVQEARDNNVVLIMTDDQNVDSLPVMRNLMSYPEGSWVNFTNAFANNSICCPARATV